MISFQMLSETEFYDTEISNLQERADRLLLQEYDELTVIMMIHIDDIYLFDLFLFFFLPLDSECTLSDRSIHVSSEGVGCSDFSSPVSVDEPLRGPLTFDALKSTSGKVKADCRIPQFIVVFPVTLPFLSLPFKAKGNSGESQPFKKSVFTLPLVTPSRPEEDILFQWRLRRKLEQARECPQPLQRLSRYGPTLNWQTPSFCGPSDSREAFKVNVIFF